MASGRLSGEVRPPNKQILYYHIIYTSRMSGHVKEELMCTKLIIINESLIMT